MTLALLNLGFARPITHTHTHTHIPDDPHYLYLVCPPYVPIFVKYMISLVLARS